MQILKLLIFISVFGFIFSLLVNKFVTFKNNIISSHFTAFMGILFGVYILSCFVSVFLIHGGVNKILMLFFAINPFLIGRAATYEKEVLYTILQVSLMVLSVSYLANF